MTAGTRLVDHTGQRFGRLVVQSRSENMGTKAAWLALCDCGEITTVRGDHLREGRVQSCGCLRREIPSNQLIDLVGMRFCRLVVSHRVDGVAVATTQPRWLCLCDCGKEVVVFGNNLKSGDSKSCGCRAIELNRERRHEVPSYEAAHMRIRSERGPASKYLCVDCGVPAHDWSYNHLDLNEYRSKQGPSKGMLYSTSVDCYEPRCRSCHKKFDNRVEKKP